jgi:hypothetical protein
MKSSRRDMGPSIELRQNDRRQVTFAGRTTIVAPIQ